MIIKHPAYMIVVKSSDASTYYANYCIPSWESVGTSVCIFPAVTPDNLSMCSDLRFARYSSMVKYVKKNIKAEITPTEKSCWCSHFVLWKRCVEMNEPILIIEHDSLLIDKTRLWCDEYYGIIFYDKAAMGSYMIYPWFAKTLVDVAMCTKISTGPYAFIATVADMLGLKDRVVNDQHSKYNPASNQVMSNKYGNTIDHYSNLHPEIFPKQTYGHEFVVID